LRLVNGGKPGEGDAVRPKRTGEDGDAGTRVSFEGKAAMVACGELL
jgi:hypothetical protein